MESPAHKFGQIIGDALEYSVAPFLRNFAARHSIYLDEKGPRPARKGNKVTWTDNNGNKHDLDFVLEKDGSKTVIGKPVAFIECAWRRYTKHSRNKAQEIQGAIIPLSEKYKKEHPFIGVILGGVFTDGALKQLESLGFSVLFFPYEIIIKGFSSVGINAQFGEDTKDSAFAKEVKKWEALSESKKRKVYKAITDQKLIEINTFLSKLELSIERVIKEIKIWSVYGKEYSFKNVEDATEFIQNYQADSKDVTFDRFEAEITYSNGDVIKVSYRQKNDFINFMKNYL